jgi:hypothetical protein
MKVQATYCADPPLIKKLILPLLFLGLCLFLLFGVGLNSGMDALLIFFALLACLPVYWFWSSFLHKHNKKQGEVSLEGTLLKHPEDEVDFSWERSVIINSGAPGTLVSVRFLGVEPSGVVFLKGYSTEAFQSLFPLAAFVRPLEAGFAPKTTLTLDAASSEHQPLIEALVKVLWEQREKSPYYRIFSALPWGRPSQKDTAGPVSVSLDPKEGDPCQALARAAESGAGVTRDDPAAFIGALTKQPLIELDQTVFLSEDHVVINSEEDDRKSRLFTAVPLNRAHVRATRDVYTFSSGGSGVGMGQSTNECIRFTLDVLSRPGEGQRFEAIFAGRSPMIAALGAPIDPFDDKLDAAIAYINHYQ